MILFSWKSYAIDTRVQDIYDTFSEKVQKNYNTDEQGEIFRKVRDIANKLSLAQEKQWLLEDIIRLNNEKLHDVWLQKELDQSSQQLKELRERISLEKQLTNTTASSNIKKLISSNREYIATNSDREFSKDGNIYRIDYSRYFVIDSSSILD